MFTIEMIDQLVRRAQRVRCRPAMMVALLLYQHSRASGPRARDVALR
jgi:hypothetical protein